MGADYKHIKNFLPAFAAVLFLSAGPSAHAQELIMPERWSKAIYDISPLYRTDTLTVLALGDIMMHQKQIENASKPDGTYDFSSYFMLIKDEIREADISIANMEFTLAGEPYTGYPCFSAPDSFATYLADCGFDVFLTANNHIFDKGTAGAERTLEVYRKLQDSHGIKFTGLAGNEDEMRGNNPLFVRSKGISLALLNFTYGTNSGLGTIWPRTNYTGERSKISKVFSDAEENDADFIVALPHWGTEYVLRHSESQEETGEWLVENGADWVIGAHPHVAQDMETVDDVHVIYSLGNAVSNMSAANTQIGLMVRLRIVRESNGDLSPLPLEFKYLWCSRPGGYNNSYTVIPVKEFIGRESEWQGKHDYHKMVGAYERVKKEIGIND